MPRAATQLVPSAGRHRAEGTAVNRVARREPLPDLFDGLMYDEWKEGMNKCPALDWDEYLAVQQLMGRAYALLRWR
jgi:hypothetical protein